MVIQHNLLAMGAQRSLGITSMKKEKAMERLSSGYKINRAADDASGLQISEKMRKQIRGLTQASANAQDGISLVQTAEGAMAEIADIVNRVEEMAVHAANGTLAESDREAIDKEFRQLKTEIDRIQATTKFNDLYTLGGESPTWGGGTTKIPTHYNGMNFFQSNYKGGLFGADPSDVFELQKDGSITLKLDREKDVDGGYTFSVLLLRDVLAGVPYTAEEQPIVDRINNSLFDYTGLHYKVDGNNYAVYIMDGIKPLDPDKPHASLEDARHFDGMWAFAYGSDGTDGKTPGTNAFDPSDGDYSVVSVNNLDELFEYLEEKNLFPVDGDNIKGWNIVDNGGAAEMKVFTWEDPPDPFKVPIHVGADATGANQIVVEVDRLDTRSLRFLDVDLKTADNALTTIKRVEYASKRVSAARAKLGAQQNRLEHTIKNLDNVVENTQAAESIIRDTDMARGMVEYSKQQILEQAGQAVLTQAQQNAQGVLSLLG